MMISGATAQTGPWPPFTGFMTVSYSTMWGYQLHDRPILDTLIQPSETSSSNYQRHSRRSRETRVRNGRWILPTSIYCARRVLLHAVNLQHETDGFTSPPKDFITLKIHHLRPGLNPRTLGPVASTLTTTPPRATVIHDRTLIMETVSYYRSMQTKGVTFFLKNQKHKNEISFITRYQHILCANEESFLNPSSVCGSRGNIKN
jgi:hypothetical protein